MTIDQLPYAPLSGAQRHKAWRLARVGVSRADIARCLNLSKDEFGVAIKGDRELVKLLAENAKRLVRH